MEGRCATDQKVTIQIRFCRGTGKRFLRLPAKDEFEGKKAIVFPALRLANGTNLLARAQVPPTQGP